MNSFLSLIIAIMMLSMFISCGNGHGKPVTDYIDNRDNIENVSIVSIEDSLPELHAYSRLYIDGDQMIIYDSKSKGNMFHAYDLRQNRLLGSFGKFGNGPGEVANLGCIFIDSQRKKLYAMNGFQCKFVGFDLEKALSVPGYDAFGKLDKLTFGDYFPMVDDGTMLNDSTVICSVYVPSSDLENRVGRLNFNTGEIEVVDSTSQPENTRATTIALPDKNLIVTVGRTHDFIKLYDLDGRLKKTVYGPDYKEEQPKNHYYYSNVAVSNKAIYAVYLGKDINQQRFGSDIQVFDLNGKYEKTLKTDSQIVSIAYDGNADRLYVSTNDYPQFGYIQL